MGKGIPIQYGQFTFQIKVNDKACNFILKMDSTNTNISPVANAGLDRVLQLPTDTVTLFGFGTDADGNVANFIWSQISGPGNSNISSRNQPVTLVSGLTQGIYKLELQVVDNLGAIGKDTVSITVNAAAATSGSLARQQDLFGVIGSINDLMDYDASGKIIKIRSDYYPERTITYSNNRIATISYWEDFGSGTLQKELVDSFVYDNNGNVSRIEHTELSAGKTFTVAEYSYNADNTLRTKNTFFSDGSKHYNNSYLYTNGNLTAIIENASSPDPGDTTYATYDTRLSSFNNINPQFYFLDIQTIYAQTNRSELFYFSKNFPISFGQIPVNVITNANGKPFEIWFNNALWYRYIYN